MKLRNIIGIIFFIISVIFSLWLSFGFMLIGGINSAIAGFEAGNVSQGVWGIVRAIFFEMGNLPMIIGWFIALLVSD